VLALLSATEIARIGRMFSRGAPLHPPIIAETVAIAGSA
jgi:hypothetical protein